MSVRCDGHTIAYDERGAGVPVVFLHGFPHDRTLWAPQLAALAGRARCIAPDLRGFGESGTDGPYDMDRYADDVICLLDALEIERAVIAGLSMGGYVSFALWRRHRARVRALVLADTRAGADAEEARQKRRDMIALARREGAPAVAERMIEGMVGRTTRRRSPEVVEWVRRMLERAPVAGIVGALEAMLSRPDSTADLATIDVPTLVLVGEEDALTPPAEARAMHARIAGSRLVTIPEAGHVSNVEQPQHVNRAITEFLDALAE